MKCIAIFASGTGTNAEKIITHFNVHPDIKVQLIVSNKQEAGVLDIARAHNIPFLIIDKERFFRGDHYVAELTKRKIGIIVLAGFLWKIPDGLIAAYREKIINIHPSLLPAYGGKGMYGSIVHESVIAAGEKESGITIHLVDEQYDHGQIIFQARCPVDDNENAASLAEKIHRLEHTHYPLIIEKLASQ